jgi:hypothetical protein
MRNYHTWSFLAGPYVNAHAGITDLEVVVAHEVAHVIINGMRAEAAAARHDQLSLERLYALTVPIAQWPHFYADTNEQLATEIAVWALGISRTSEVDTLRYRVLAPSTVSDRWSDALAELYPPPSISR